MNRDKNTDQEIKKIYELKNIAVVGMSKNFEKPSNFVPQYLSSKGFNIIPVNPTTEEIGGKKSYKQVSEIKDPIDIVQIFRKSDDVLPVVEDALMKKGIKVIWMQEGIYNQIAEEKALDNNLIVVYNRCMMEEHKRLFGK